MVKGIKNIALFIIMALLFLPMIQNSIPIVKLKKLKGSFAEIENPEYNIQAFLNGSYQEQYNEYLEQNIGFRPFFVRVNNQIAYSLYRKALANQVIIGHDHILYEENYIKAYLGRNFLGDSNWDIKIKKIKTVQDELKKLDIDLLILFAPGKASFFPESIPARYNIHEKTKTNQEYLIEQFNERNINYIDFNSWFVSMKDTTSYPLYPNCGIHWSAYGVGLAMDSLKRCLEDLKGRKMIDFGWNGYDFPDTLRHPDYDIAEGMNLLFKIKYIKMAYPRFYFNSDSNTYKPNTLTIGDSYYWMIFGNGISQQFYNKEDFWYYNRMAHGTEYVSGKPVADLDKPAEILKRDFIVLISTEANLHKFAFGFIDDIYDMIEDGSLNRYDEGRIAIITDYIRSDATWMEAIREKAAKQNIGIEEMIRLDAIWLIENENNK